MDGIHDLGGMHGFGRVEPAEQPGFHAPWEARVAALVVRLLMDGYFNIDAFRHGIETMDPVAYLTSPYFGRWRHTVETNLIAGGWIGRDELEARRRALRRDLPPPAPAPARPKPPPPAPGFVREVPRAARFRVGEAVHTRSFHPPGHTRLPRYARGKRGRVERVHAAYVFPDTHAHGLGEHPQHLYSVRFDGRELWDAAAESNTSVAVDLFESYLEPEEARG